MSIDDMKMTKKGKYIIIALVGAAVLCGVLFFVLGNKKEEYTIVFDSSGGSSVSSQIVIEGNTVTKPTNPTKDKYNFIRWEYENKEYDFSSKVASNMTLKAIWEEVKEELMYYDIQFMIDGKTKTLSLSSITENDLQQLGFEEKEGYEIVWYVNGEEYDFTKPLASNMVIEGKYVKLTMYTIKFNSNGGTSVASQKVKPNEKATEPEAITKHGYIFDGWYLDKNKYDFETPVTKNITLTAKWKEDENVKRYEVTFDSDGGSKVDKQRIIDGEKASEPKAPTKSGYKFIGWYLDDKKYDFKTKVTNNITLKAMWEKIVQYTVTFNKDNGTANDTVTVNEGSKVAKPKNPTKDGYTFVEWLYNNETFDFNTAITENITLTARYKAVTKYTVTFDSNGGTSVSSQSVEEGKKATEPSKPTKADNEFVEWQLNGTKYIFSSPVTEDITLVAKWKEKTYSYKVIATKADAMASPDSYIKVYRDNQQISFKAIKVRGVTLCDGTQQVPVATTADLNGLTSVTVVLSDNSEVTASLVMQ